MEKLLFAFTLLVLLASPAGARECALCTSAQSLQVLVQKKPGTGVRAGTKFLETLKFSKDPAQIQQEMDAIVKLAGVLLPADPEKRAAEALNGISQEHPAAFQKSLKLLSPALQKKVREDIHAAEAALDGNG